MEKKGKSSKVQKHLQKNERRASGRLETDNIVLKVGKDTIDVKKEVLIASSQYFKAKFSGHFSDSNARELDLTEDVDGIEDLKILLDFQESKKVDITVDNLCSILKVSSFFLVDNLTEYCAKFMTETICLANCVQYYILAVSFSLPQRFTRKFESFVRARFHDLIIFDDFVAEDINDEELKMLCNSKILKYCSKESLFNFLLKWLSKSQELTAIQYEVVSDVIQFFEQCKTTRSIPFQCDKKKTMANVNRLTDTIRKLCEPELMQKFRLLFTNFLRNKECVFLQIDIHSADTCVGIFTVSKRVSVYRNLTGNRNHCKCSFYMPSVNSGVGSADMHEVFDICVYQPDTKVWFHIRSFHERDYFNHVDGRPYTPTVEMLKVKRFPVTIFCDIEVTGKEVLLRDVSNKFKLVRLDLQKRIFTSFKITNIVPNYEAHQFVRGRNGITYLVTRNSFQYPFCIEFQGHTFDFETRQVQRVFSITDASWNINESRYVNGKMKAKLSAVSNELFILSSQGSDNDLALVVDLYQLEKGGEANAYTLFNNGNLDLQNDDILELEDSFLIVSTANNLLNVKFRYKFSSKILDKVEDGWHYDILPVGDSRSEKGHHFIFRDSFWVMEEEFGYTSRMKKIRLDQSGHIDIEEHIPPPFVEPVSVYATELRKSLFCNLEPVSHFLEHPQWVRE